MGGAESWRTWCRAQIEAGGSRPGVKGSNGTADSQMATWVLEWSVCVCGANERGLCKYAHDGCRRQTDVGRGKGGMRGRRGRKLVEMVECEDCETVVEAPELSARERERAAASLLLVPAPPVPSRCVFPASAAAIGRPDGPGSSGGLCLGE